MHTNRLKRFFLGQTLNSSLNSINMQKQLKFVKKLKEENSAK